MALVLGSLVLLNGCRPREQRQFRRYQLRGTVISVDRHIHQATIGHEEIPGFMKAMTMTYLIKDDPALQQLQPGDQITAEVVVAEGQGIWLERITIVKKAPEKSAGLGK